MDIKKILELIPEEKRVDVEKQLSNFSTESKNAQENFSKIEAENKKILEENLKLKALNVENKAEVDASIQKQLAELKQKEAELSKKSQDLEIEKHFVNLTPEKLDYAKFKTNELISQGKNVIEASAEVKNLIQKTFGKQVDIIPSSGTSSVAQVTSQDTMMKYVPDKLLDSINPDLAKLKVEKNKGGNK